MLFRYRAAYLLFYYCIKSLFLFGMFVYIKPTLYIFFLYLSVLKDVINYFTKYCSLNFIFNVFVKDIINFNQYVSTFVISYTEFSGETSLFIVA